MVQVYKVTDDGRTEVMTRIRCKDEDRELQRLLEHNHDLLPGEQIDPDDPRRWMLVKREMPVPDPGTGTDRWSVDFVFLDHDAVPTFVECKRFKDTRSRREVVGQALEYAANGHYYWTKDDLRKRAEQTAQQRGLTLPDVLQNLQPSDSLDSDAFFERAEENLRQGQVRIVFFMEESPFELRSVVDFLNRQTERSEILLVEARQYESDGRRIVVPVLFGFTEQARLAKRIVTVDPAGSRHKWDPESFFTDTNRRLSPAHAQAVKHLYEQCLTLDADITWGTGRDTGSFNLKESDLLQRSLITVTSAGLLSFNFGWLRGSTPVEALRDRLKELVVQRLGMSLGADYAARFVSLPVEQWAAKVDTAAGILRDVLEEARTPAV